MGFPYSEIVLSLEEADCPTKFVTLSNDDKLRFSETASVFDRETKLTVENASSDVQLVHIKSSNHKYWARTKEGVIVASADKPNEDESSMNCTLFRPILEGSTSVRFVVHDGLNVAHKSCEGGGDCLTVVEAGDSVHATEFSIVDYESLFKLPRRVVFRGVNGKFLGNKNRVYNDLCYTEPRPETSYYIFHTREGDIRLKCGYNNKFLTLHDLYWIYSQAEEEDNDPRGKFEVIKVDSKPGSIELRNRSNNVVLQTKIESGYEGWLISTDDQPPGSGTLEVIEEPYVERKIEVIQFRFDEATVYDLTDKVISTKNPWNKASVVRQCKLLFDETITTCYGAWTNGPNFLKTSFKFSSKVPLIGSDMNFFEINEPIPQPYEWGKEVLKTQTIRHMYIVTVPKSSAIDVQMVCKSASYDIPFSYTQTDLYPDGTSETTLFTDGLYSGTNVYGVSYETQKPVHHA